MPFTSPHSIPIYQRANQLLIALTKLQSSHDARQPLVQANEIASAELVSVPYKVERLGRPLTTTHGWMGAGQIHFDAVVREIVELITTFGTAIAAAVSAALESTDTGIAERAARFVDLARKVFETHDDKFLTALSQPGGESFAALVGISPQRLAS